MPSQIQSRSNELPPPQQPYPPPSNAQLSSNPQYGSDSTPSQQQVQVAQVQSRTDARAKVYTSSEAEPGFIEHICTCFACCCCCPFLICCYQNLMEYERAVIFRMGRLKEGKAVGPGIFLVLPCVDSCFRVDLRSQSFDIPKQEVLTYDSVTVSVDAVMYYHVSDPVLAVTNVMNYSYSTKLLAASLLRSVLGMQTLAQILGERERIANTLKAVLDEATDPWGIKVERVELKDVRLPAQIQRAMAAEAGAVREARAKVVAADGEVRASKALREAANVMVDSPCAFQIRYLQTLQGVAAKNNFTCVVPLPLEVLKELAR